MARPSSVFLIVMMLCCARYPPTPLAPLFFCPIVLVIVCDAKGRPEERGGRDRPRRLKQSSERHTAKNIYVSVNYAKTFLQGTVMNVFEGHAPGGKNAVWKLTVCLQDACKEPALGVKFNTSLSVNSGHK